MEVYEMQDYLIEMEIATADEVALVSAINGYNEETMTDILYVKTGYRTFEQIMEE